MERKHICFLTDSIFTIGGVQRVTAVVASQLTRHCAVTIVTFDSPGARNDSLYDADLSQVAFRFFSYPRPSAIKKTLCRSFSLLYRRLLPQVPLTHRAYARSSFPSELRRALAEDLNSQPYEAIIAVHAPLATRLATLRPLLRCQRLIGWLHNSYGAMYSDASPYAGKELRRFFIHQLKSLYSTIVLSNADAGEYERAHGFRPLVIYNPLTLRPGPVSQGTSRSFLAVGRMTPGHKGFDLLIEAFCRFRAANSEWTLDIVGEGPEEEALRQAAHRLGLGEAVRFHPFTTDIQRYYSSAQVFVLSSRWEGLPLVLAEAMSHGLPVVASSLPVCREILGGDYPLLFPVGDSIALARTLEAATHTDWPAMSRKSLDIVATRFGTEAITRQWLDAINN